MAGRAEDSSGYLLSDRQGGIVSDHGRWILFADMDGTVLDPETYEPGPALEALEQCREAGVPVVLNSSKTRAEMAFFYERLPLLPGSPFVSENGGGVFLPSGYWERPAGAEASVGFWKIALGTPHRKLLPVLKKIVQRLRLDARLFSDLTPEEIAAMTGLPVEQAGLAREREFDEPFWVREGDLSCLDTLREELRKEGLRLSRGGRCLHVHGASDKGAAARYVAGLYREMMPVPVRSAGVGDAANDLPLLETVDRAYLVRRADGTLDPDIPPGRGIRPLPGSGPLGFRQAVEDLLGRAVVPETERRGGKSGP
jgi:mannosyl-3-phosphoglycerate phosphatase family protein